jgi:hypothetical protein
MLATHLGQEVEIDPKQAAFENSLIAVLRKHGPTKQKDLWYRANGIRLGPYQEARELFQLCLDSLVEKRVIVRLTTTRRNSFIFRMAPDKRRSERAKRKQLLALQEVSL